MTFLASFPPPGPARDRVIIDAIVNGMLDAPTWFEVLVDDRSLSVSARYLTICGETVPMTGEVAQVAVDSLDAALPTVAIVDAIERAPGVVLAHLPTQVADGGESSAKAFVRCEEETRAMLAALKVADCTPVAGYRKDVVAPAPEHAVAIYGARWAGSGARLQPYSTRHALIYSDYSHAVRAVRGIVKPWRYPLPW